MSNGGNTSKLPQVKGAISPLETKDKEVLINAGLGAIGSHLG